MTETGHPVGRETLYFDRRFLNQPGHHALAAIQAEIAYEPPSETYNGVIEAHLTISDCNRTVKLVFTLFSDERTNNDLLKLEALSDILENFYAELHEAKNNLDRARRDLKDQATLDKAAEMMGCAACARSGVGVCDDH